MAFDDDDVPTASRQPAAGSEDAPTLEEEMEDGVADFTKLSSMFAKKGISGKTIRKGEKDFESHGTQAQDKVLEASRQAMEEVLSYTRIHRRDAWVRAWYFPDRFAELEGEDDDIQLRERVVVVEHEKGNWMKDIGRSCPSSKDAHGAGRLWLLPEEALYLVERGTIDLWWPNKSFEELLPKTSDSDGQQRFGPDDYEAGLPLTLEAAYTLLVGFEGERGKTTFSKYHVFTHLKRGGFNILRAPQNPELPSESRAASPPWYGISLWQSLFSFLSLRQEPKVNSQGPLVAPGLYRTYHSIYQQLAIIPRHKPSPAPAESTEPQDPFKIFYHVWKSGGAPFSKRNPPAPDFRIAVTDTSDTFVPDLGQIESLLESTPYDPPNPAWQGPGRVYQRLKWGHRNVLVAIVDRGLVNFMRFGEGAFGEEKVYERFDNPRGRYRGGKGGRGGGRGGRGRGRGKGRR
ncbi:unnamed protein product [Clonostachys chloroleuca]|uniref:tRNA-splicing endonuclease subunit Sen54 N-terminal domain-containing protein n=1 Tax=Clonostachys chloroleuca TaxID=1926264 RepID=A0AA35VJX7_9HYPO|nr:unnamed protein product [Clonostachys chloroleuca]